MLRGTTVGVETKALGFDGGTQYINVPSRGSFIFDIDIVARAAGSVNGWYGNFSHYRVAVENQNSPLTWAFMDTYSLTNHNPNMLASLASSGSQLKIQGTGEASETIHWVATVSTTELVKP